MPVKKTYVGKGKVRVSTSRGVKAKATTPAKAKKQERLLNAVDHGWEPTGKPGQMMAKKQMPKGMPPKGMMVQPKKKTKKR